MTAMGQKRTLGKVRLMSALGQKQTFKRLRLMSALPPKADIDGTRRDVRFVPKAEVSEFIQLRCRRALTMCPARSGLMPSLF